MPLSLMPLLPTAANNGRQIIGIDLATTAGWAVLSADGRRIDSGAWSCKVQRGEGPSFRYIRFRRYLRALVAAYPDAILVYEKVERHLGTDAAHVYGALEAALQEVCDDLAVPYHGIGVKVIKQTATGKGTAKKEAMVASANVKWSPHVVSGHDEADALWCAECERLENV